MDYETLIEEMKMQCVRKQISFYKLSKISGIPQSTIYRVMKDKNKAQMDTLYELLKALEMKIMLVPADKGTAFEIPAGQD